MHVDIKRDRIRLVSVLKIFKTTSNFLSNTSVFFILKATRFGLEIDYNRDKNTAFKYQGNKQCIIVLYFIITFLPGL